MIVAFLAVLGLVMGSFAEALVWRLHHQATHRGKQSAKLNRQLSIIRGRSICPHCQHQLTARDLIPLFSWLSLRGRCRYCRKPIGWQAPLMELATAGLFMVSYWAWPFALTGVGLVQLAFWLVFVVGFVALMAYDYRWMILPNKIVYGLLGLAIGQTLVLGVLQRQPSLVLGALLGGVVLGGLFLVLFQLSAGRWIGGGDVKLGAMLGILLGSPTLSFLVLFLASTGGSLVSLPLLLSGRLKRTSRIPFGPLLLIAAIIVQLFGRDVVAWYQRVLVF